MSQAIEGLGAAQGGTVSLVETALAWRFRWWLPGEDSNLQPFG